MVSKSCESSSLSFSSAKMILLTSSLKFSPNHDVKVKKSSLLLFNRCHPDIELTEDASFFGKPYEFLLLFIEHTSNYIMAIISILILNKLT